MLVHTRTNLVSTEGFLLSFVVKNSLKVNVSYGTKTFVSAEEAELTDMAVGCSRLHITGSCHYPFHDVL